MSEKRSLSAVVVRIDEVNSKNIATVAEFSMSRCVLLSSKKVLSEFRVSNMLFNKGFAVAADLVNPYDLVSTNAQVHDQS
jgi:hypothetical protein